MRIALIQPPVWGIYEPSVAIAQLSACLKKSGHEVHVFDLNVDLYNNRTVEYKNVWAIEQSSFWGCRENVSALFSMSEQFIDSYVNSILSTKPQLICFSVNALSVQSTLILSEKIKVLSSKAVIAVGGPLFLVDYDELKLLGNSSIDVIVRGEGEKTICEAAQMLESGENLASCRGISYKDSGKVCRNEGRDPIADLDELPFMDFEQLPFNKYDPPPHLGKHLSMMTSRGCVWGCVFCGPKAYWHGYRAMGGKRVFDEICFHIKNHPEIEHIEFLDLLLNGKMSSLTELCGLLASKPPKPALNWHANSIIREEMTPDVLGLMKRAGCVHISYGIESGSQKVLDFVKKRYRVEVADKVLKYTHDAGIKVTCNFMFGLPGETEDDFNKTLEFIDRNRNYIDEAYPSRSFCTIEPNSYLDKHPEEFNVIPDKSSGHYWESKDGENNYIVRMKRGERFSEYARKIGVQTGLGLQTSIEMDRALCLGSYYEAKKDYKSALESFNEYLKLDPANCTVKSRINEIISRIK